MTQLVTSITRCGIRVSAVDEWVIDINIAHRQTGRWTDSITLEVGLDDAIVTALISQVTLLMIIIAII